MTVSEWQKIEGAHVTESLRAIGEKLQASDDELVLDFAAVRNLNPGALSALGELATAAQEKNIRLVLRAVNIDVYKVLKLAKLAARMAFLN